MPLRWIGALLLGTALVTGALLAGGGGATTATPTSTADAATLDLPQYNKRYRARQVGGEIVIETSVDGGRSVAYGTSLPAPSLPVGAPLSLFAVGRYAYVAIHNEATGYDYVKGWDASRCDADCGTAGEPWVPIRNTRNDTSP